MIDFISCTRCNKEIKEDNNELKDLKNVILIRNKKHIEKEKFYLQNNLTNISVLNSTQCFSNRKTTEEIDELNIIEYPEQRRTYSRPSKLSVFKPCTKKVLSDDENNYYSDDVDEDSLSDSNIIYNNCDEYSSIKDNLCDYCEEIYKNAFKNGLNIEKRICLYCNKLISQKNYEKMIKEGKFNEIDSVIENCSSYYDINQNSFISNNKSISKKNEKKVNKMFIYTKKFVPIPLMNKTKTLKTFRVNNKIKI